jgi:transposase
MSSGLRPVCQCKYVHVTERGLAFFEAYSHSHVYKSLLRSYLAKIMLDKVSGYVFNNGDMRAQPSDDPRLQSLREFRALHRHPERVRDETFRSDDFFDPRDLLQVRYEMLRRHRVDGQAVSAVAHSFGFSRQAFYVTDAHFRAQGLAGLLPRRRGPRRAHKCTDEILDFVEQWGQTADGKQSVVEAVRRRFGVRINARSIERAMKRRKKKPPTQRQAQD